MPSSYYRLQKKRTKKGKRGEIITDIKKPTLCKVRQKLQKQQQNGSMSAVQCYGKGVRASEIWIFIIIHQDLQEGAIICGLRRG